jgi:hypothetical protein
LVFTDVSVLLIGLIFKGEAVQDCLTLEDGTDRLSRNDGNQPPIYAMQQRRKVNISCTLVAEAEITHYVIVFVFVVSQMRI